MEPQRTAKRHSLEQQDTTMTPSSPAQMLSHRSNGDIESVSTTKSNNNSSASKKRSLEQITFECNEKMPKMQTFSRFRPHPLMPHQIIVTAYTTLMKGDFSGPPQCQLLHNYPSLNETLRLLLPWKNGHEQTTESNEKDGDTWQKALENIPEILRMQSFGFPIKPLIDFPLSYDWSIPLGLGITTGSAAFNRCVLQAAALHSECHDIPQLSPEEYYMALRHETQQAATAHIISPSVDESTRDVYQKLLQVDTLTTSTTRWKNAAQLKELLGQLHTRAAALRTRQYHCLKVGERYQATSTTPTESESVVGTETKRTSPSRSLPWSTALSSLLAQQGYDDPNAFCSPNDTLY